jgi:hypothetical protein
MITTEYQAGEGGPLDLVEFLHKLRKERGARFV